MRIQGKVCEPNREATSLWVAALRDPGRFQGQAYLRAIHNGKAYECCLGVVCDVVKDVVRGRWGWLGNENEQEFITTDTDGTNVDLTPTVAAYLFGTKNMAFTDPPLLVPRKAGAKNYMYRDASYCNDTLQLNFQEIADAIVRTYLR